MQSYIMRVLYLRRTWVSLTFDSTAQLLDQLNIVLNIFQYEFIQKKTEHRFEIKRLYHIVEFEPELHSK